MLLYFWAVSSHFVFFTSTMLTAVEDNS